MYIYIYTHTCNDCFLNGIIFKILHSIFSQICSIHGHIYPLYGPPISIHVFSITVHHSIVSMWHQYCVKICSDWPPKSSEKRLKEEYLLFFFLFRATPVSYGSSQARGQIGAAAAGLYHRHSNSRSKPCLQLMLQLVAMPDPWPNEQGQG